MLALPTLALVETEPELRRRLFDDYNPVQRPSVAMAQSCGEVEVPPDRVQVQFSTSRIHSISSVDESYGIDGYLRICMPLRSPTIRLAAQPASNHLLLTCRNARNVQTGTTPDYDSTARPRAAASTS